MLLAIPLCGLGIFAAVAVYRLPRPDFFGDYINMKDKSPRAELIEKMQRRIAELVVVTAGPLIAALVIIQLYYGVISVKGGDVMVQTDPFSFYLLNGILGCVGIIALIISALTARHLFQNRRKRMKSRP